MAPKATASSAAQTERIKSVSKNVSTIVKDAAAILDDEVASGIVAAKRVQDRFQKERRVENKDFSGALQKFNTDAHEILNLVGDQIDAMSSRENSELTKRLFGRTHDVLDLTIEMINISAELADQLAQKTKPTKTRTKPTAKAAAKTSAVATPNAVS
jgi:hypothetical protein